jgi:hypothetical protein
MWMAGIIQFLCSLIQLMVILVVFFSLTQETVLLNLLLHCQSIMTYSVQLMVGQNIPMSIYAPWTYGYVEGTFSITI